DPRQGDEHRSASFPALRPFGPGRSGPGSLRRRVPAPRALTSFVSRSSALRAGPLGPRLAALTSVLGKETEVVVEVRLYLVDAVADHRDPLEPEAEREALPDLGIAAHFEEHVRVDHPAAAELDPAGVRAHAAPLAV